MFNQSLLNPGSIRLRTKKLRTTAVATGRRLTQIFLESNNSNPKSSNLNESSPLSKFRKSFHLSPKSSAKNIPEFQSPTKVVPESPKILETPPPPEFSELPTKFLIETFKYLDGSDLIKLRFVSKRFNEIIQNHALELPKIKIEALNLCHPSGDEHQIQPIKSSKCEPMAFENMDKPLRHLKTQNLALTGITVTSKLIRFLHRSIKYQLKELRFIECGFLIKSNELLIMINQWKPSFLHFNNCKWIPDTSNATEEFSQKFLDDQFFSVNKSFDSLCVDFSSSSSMQRLGFTDKFAQIFNDPTKLPSSIILNNCFTNITAKTLEIAIQRYIDISNQISPKSLPEQYLWSFGTIADNKANLLSTISNFQQYIVSQIENQNAIECIFQVFIDSPLLFLSFKFKSLKSWENKTSKKRDCKILWEEIDGFDFPEGFL